MSCVFRSCASPLFCLSALTAATAIVGCTGNVVTTSDATATTTAAFVSIERSVNVGPASGAAFGSTDQDGTSAGAQAPSNTPATKTTNLNASAIFLRVSTGADERLAARLIGADLAVPKPDQCAPVEMLHDEGMPLSSLGPIDLVDVGEVAIETETAHAPLSPRAFPSIADLVQGVLYTTRDGAGTRLPEKGVFRLRASGSASFGATVLEASSPGAIPGLLVANRPLDENPIVLPRADISLDWETSGDDVVYADLATMDDGPVERVRCTFRDTGHGTIPAAVLPNGQTQRLSVHMLHQEAVSVPGLDGGQFRIDEAVTANLRFEVKKP